MQGPGISAFRRSTLTYHRRNNYYESGFKCPNLAGVIRLLTSDLITLLRHQTCRLKFAIFRVTLKCWIPLEESCVPTATSSLWSSPPPLLLLAMRKQIFFSRNWDL